MPQSIDAAVAAFLTKGFAAASMDRITSTADVSKRTVNRHFQSKEDLSRPIVETLSESTSEGLTIGINRATQKPGRPVRSLRHQIEAVGVHDLGPGRYEIAHELFRVVILCVDFRVRPQDRV